MASSAPSRSWLRTLSVLTCAGFAALVVLALLARPLAPELWTWTAAYAAAGALTAALLGGLVPGVGPGGAGTLAVLVTVVLAIVLVVVGGLGGLALAASVYAVVALWQAARAQA